MAAQTPTTPGTALAVIAPSRPLRGRRHFLGDAIAGLAGAVILAGAGITMATTEALGGNPGEADNALADAELTALCDQFCRLESAYCRAINNAPPSEDKKASERAGVFTGQQWDLVERIAPMPAATMAGMRAKAVCVVMHGVDGCDAEGGPGDRILASLMSDLAGFRVEDEMQGQREMRRRFEAGETA